MRTWRSTSSICSDALVERPTRPASLRFFVTLAAGFFVSCAGPQSTKDAEIVYGDRYDSCVAGDLDGCVDHARSLLQSNGALARRTALVAFQYGCFLDHAPSCAGLARVLGKADGGSSSERIHSALERACAGGEMSACVDLAARVGGRRAEELYRSACDAGEGRGCHALAAIVRQSWKLESQLVAAVQLDEKACELGTVDGCVTAGQAYLFGSGVVQDAEHGLELLERGCTPEIGSSCETLAQIWEQGIGVRSDPERAQGYHDLASRHATGADAVNAEELAFVVYAEACNRGDVLGCFDAGWYRAEGREVERNITVAREFFERACASGLKTACNRWSEVGAEAKGPGVPAAAEPQP